MDENDPTPTPKWDIPAINPDFNAPGVQGLVTAGDAIAGGALVLAVIAIILGVVLAAVGPRMGFHGAKALGIGGVIGGLAVGGVVALATDSVATVGTWMS